MIQGAAHKAMADQLATVSKLRLKEYIGLLGMEDMSAVESAIKLQLAIP